jgi:RNA polymerase sigma factor (sigma-70 family)
MANLDRAVLFKQIDRLYRDGTFTAQSDGQLLDRYLSYRDEGAFEAIVNLHGPMVLSLCRRFLRDPRDIEDAFQATFLILARKAGSIRQRDVLSSWLYGVAYRIAVRARSEVLKRRSIESSVPLLDDPVVVAARDVDEIGPVLDQELRRLPDKYRAPIVLCYLKEHTHDQAAAALRWPVGTVRSRLARGRELLKERLTRRGCSPATAMLGFGPGFSTRSCAASVPQPLVQATVAAASQFLWGAGSGVGPAALAFAPSSYLSGSATALAQGVLTTMALTPIKLISAGLTAGLLAGGLGMGAWALGSPGKGQQDATPAPAQKPAEKAATKPNNVDFVPKTTVPEPATASPTPGVEARLADLERKLDLLLQRLSPSPMTREKTVPPDGRSPLDVAPAPPGDSPFVTSGGAQIEPPPPVHAQPTEPVDSNAVPVLESQPPAEVQPPPAAARAASPFEEDQPRVSQRAVLPPPSADVPTLPAARSTEESQPPASAVEPPTPASYSQQARRRSDPFETPAPQRTSLKEIEAQVQIARQHHERTKTLYASNAISREQYEAPLDQIRLLIARLEGMDEDFADDLLRLKLEIVKKRAQLRIAEAQRSTTADKVAWTKRMEEKKMVSKSETSKAEAEDTAALARIEVQRSELQDAEVRMQQVLRRREMIKRDVALVLKAIPEVARERGPAPDAGDFPLQRR